MQHAHKILIDEISRLPLEKVSKALSFVRYLEQEPDSSLVIDEAEELELMATLQNGEMMNAQDVLASIEALPDD